MIRTYSAKSSEPFLAEVRFDWVHSFYDNIASDIEFLIID